MTIDGRSVEYSMLVSSIFLLSDDALESELLHCELTTADENDFYTSDVTYGEWQFLLMHQLGYRMLCYTESKARFHSQLEAFTEEAQL